MRVMVVGQGWLGAQVLSLCIDRGDNVVAVSAPGMGDRLAVTAASAGTPVRVAAGRLPAEHVPVGVDLILCAHAHAFVPAEARARSRLGALGYHPSLLPRHRGRDAIHWTLAMRDLVAGGTVYWLDDGADTGPIAAQDWCWVQPGDTPAVLWRRDLAPMGLRLLAEVLADLDAGRVVAMPQEADAATWEPAYRPQPLG